MKMNIKINLLIISLLYLVNPFDLSMTNAQAKADVARTNDGNKINPEEDQVDDNSEEDDAQALEENEPEEEKSRWFEVELIVFKPNNERAMDDESWDKNLTFTPSDNLVDFLQPYYLENEITPQLADDLDNSQLDNSQLDNLQDATQQKSNQAQHTLSDASLTNSSIVDINDLDEEAKLLLKFNQPVQEKPFVLLADNLLKLNNEAASLNRHPDYKVLTHIGWRQPMVAKNDSKNIRIAGGNDLSEFFSYDGAKLNQAIDETVDDESNNQLIDETAINSAINSPKYLGLNQTVLTAEKELAPVVPNIVPMLWVPELDGDIKIYLNRYLHIQTNMFLRKPGKEIIEVIDLDIYNPEALSRFSLENNNTEFKLNRNSFNQNSLNQNNINQKNINNGNNPLNATQNNNLLGNAYTDKNSHQFSWEISDSFLSEESEKMYIERLFNYSIKQSRRVRSGELHYFDHPLMGIIILITPYELPELPIGNLNETTNSKKD